MTTESAINEKNTIVAQFLVVEFEVLHQRAILQQQSIATKINFHVAVSTAIAGGALLATSNSTFTPFFLPVSCFIFAFLLLLGIATLRQTLELSVASTFFYRRTGRIRKWFHDLDPSVHPYLPFSISDNLPQFYSERIGLRGIESILLIINAIVSGTLAFLLILLLYRAMPQIRLVNEQLLFLFGISVGTAALISTWSIQVKYVRNFLMSQEKYEEERRAIRFPLIQKLKEESEQMISNNKE